MEKTELDAICKEILALEGVIGLVCYNKRGEIVLVKYNVEPEYWIFPYSPDEIERKMLAWGEMVCETASEICKYFGELEAVAFIHEKRNSFLIPLNELCIGISAKKTAAIPLIDKAKKIITKHTRR